jgi:hypothetical protein
VQGRIGDCMSRFCGRPCDFIAVRLRMPQGWCQSASNFGSDALLMTTSASGT